MNRRRGLIHSRASHTGKGALLWLFLVAVVGTLGYAGWERLRSGPAPVLPAGLEQLDPEVAAVVREKAGAVEKDRRDARGHGTLGLVYEANSMWSEAAGSFANAVALNPEEALWAYHQAYAMRQAGEVEAGLELLIKTAARLPSEAGVQLFLGYTLLDDNRLEEAKQAFDRVARMFPDRSEGYAGQGELMLARKDYGGATRVLEKALGLDPGLTIAHYSLGLAYRGLGRMNDAQRELNLGLGARRRMIGTRFSVEAREFAVNYAGVINRASDLLDAGKPALAARMLEKLLETRPKDTNVLNNLGIAYMNMKQYERALELLLIALEVDGTAFATHLNLAGCYQERGDLPEALKYADRAVELAPEIAAAHFTRTRILAASNRIQEAYASARKAVSLDTRDPYKYIALGELTAMLQQTGEARVYFQKAVDLAPNYLPGQVNLARMLLDLGELDQAETVIAGAERLAPQHPRVKALRGLLVEQRRKGQ